MIYLIRHGQTDWNLADKIQGQTDIPLNETGRKQALCLSPQISKLHLKQIVTSDLKRARETAQLLNTEAHVPIISDERLREINFGDLEGHPVPELTPETWQTLSLSGYRFHAESLSDVYRRVQRFFSDLDPADNTLVVTHGGLLKISSYYIKNPNQFDYTLFSSMFSSILLPNTTLFRWTEQNDLEQLDNTGI